MTDQHNDHVTDNRRTLGAVVLFVLAGVIFAAMIVLLVNRTLDVSTLSNKLAGAREEIETLRQSNARLSRRMQRLTDTALDNRALLRDIIEELDREERQRVREQVSASSTAQTDDDQSTTRQREPSPRESQPSPRPPHRAPRPRPPDDPGRPDDPGPPDQVCIPAIDVCL